MIEVLGQPEVSRRLNAATQQPVPAYLFVGPAGSGKRRAAAQFAAELFARSRPDDADRHRRLAIAGHHPDLMLVERGAGATITTEQAREVVRSASLSPVDAGCKVIVLDDFHLVGGQTAMVLKAIEEPPPSTFFVVLANDIPPELVTIASRCLTIEFSAVSEADLIAALVADGADPALAETAARAAGGDVGRARLLATDPDLLARLDAWAQVAERLDGSGHMVMTCVNELVELIDAASEPLLTRQASELDDLTARAEATGGRVVGERDIEARHKREARRLRSDEIRLGLATLGQRYRSELIAGTRSAEDAARSIQVLTEASGALTRNPNERLLLADAFARLRG